MVEQTRARNATAIQNGRVDLRRGSVISLPFDGNSFDKALAINSMQGWPDSTVACGKWDGARSPALQLSLDSRPILSIATRG